MEIANRSEKESEIWESVVVVTYTLGKLDLLVFKVIWGHSVHFSYNSL